jgi:hypothetical protein
MSIFLRIPQRSRSLPSSVIFSAAFGTITPGKYDFSALANQAIVVIPLQTGVLYLIEKYAISGNIAEPDYITSISTLPLLNFRRFNGNDTLSSSPVPVTRYHEMEDINLWAKTEKGNDYLTCGMTGIINQNINTVGIDPLRIVLSLQIWAIDEKEFNKTYSSDITQSQGLFR